MDEILYQTVKTDIYTDIWDYLFLMYLFFARAGHFRALGGEKIFKEEDDFRYQKPASAQLWFFH